MNSNNSLNELQSFKKWKDARHVREIAKETGPKGEFER